MGTSLLVRPVSANNHGRGVGAAALGCRMKPRTHCQLNVLESKVSGETRCPFSRRVRGEGGSPQSGRSEAGPAPAPDRWRPRRSGLTGGDPLPFPATSTAS